MKYLKSFFWDIDFAVAQPFNDDPRNRRGTFEWVCKYLVSFRRNHSSSDVYIDSN